MAPRPPPLNLNLSRAAKEQPLSWKDVEAQDRIIIKEVCKRARQKVFWTWYRVSETLDWEDVATTVGPGFTAQYCRYVYILLSVLLFTLTNPHP